MRRKSEQKSEQKPEQKPVPGPGSVWIFVDLPIGGPTGAAYMAESWARELRELGWQARIYSPTTRFGDHWETPEHVAFRTIMGVGFKDDHHPVFSMLRQLWKYRRRRDRPSAIVVTTPMRMGSLGLALANVFRIPLVIAVSTDTTAWAQHHSSTRLILASWPKFLLFGLIRPDLGWKMAYPSLWWIRKYGWSWSAGVAARYSWVFQHSAKELILLGERNALDYAHPHKKQRVNTFSAGIDRLPASDTPIELPWRPGALRLLFVGRLVTEKAIHVLVNAVGICKARGLDIQLACVGEGQYAAELPRLAEFQGIDDLIVAGPFPRNQLRSVYASGDVFGFASTFDTQGFVLNEAAHEGLPLLVADDINRVCVHEESALVVDQTPEAFAEALGRLADPQLRARLGAGARRLAERFSEKGQIRDVAVILDRVTGRSTFSQETTAPEVVDLREPADAADETAAQPAMS
ncbi:glycosyltransferase [Spongisporangium articulatum]|uniref:Glycosyltransferase n=1 Tax=Spongisporangium articulatum TaxID=3362603 RepID=A0ABW8AMD1_9ACTN